MDFPLFTLPEGWFRGSGDNEVELVSNSDDPPKFRMASPGPGRSLGCLSFNRIRGTHPGDGQDEKVLIQGKLSDDGLSGEFGIWLFDETRGGTDDHKMGDPVLYVTPAGVWVNGASLGGGAPLPPSATLLPSALVSPSGRYRHEMQDDGNSVVYDTGTPSVGWRAVWSWMTGTL